MASLNKVILIGRIGRDPELKYTTSGQAVASLSVATDEGYTGKDGQKVEKTEWHRVTAWGKQAEFCGKYLTKGRLVYVEGSLETRKWQDKEGVERYVTEVKALRVMGLDPKQDGAARRPDPMDEDYGQAYPSGAGRVDDAPF